MYKIKIITIILTMLIFMLNSSFVKADYLKVNLFYENGNIYIDKETEPFQLIESNVYVDDSIIESDFKIQLISSNKLVPPIESPISVKNGRFSVNIPWLPHIISFQLLKNDSLVQEISLENINSCNSNNICEYEKGENEETCILDCIGNNINYSIETQKTLQANNGVIRDQEGTVLLRSSISNSNQSTNNDTSEENSALDFIPLIIGLILIVVGVVTFIYFKFKKK